MPTHPSFRTSRIPLALATSLLAAGGIVTAGCSSAPSENASTTSGALTASDAVSRAEQWVSAALQYCQSPYGDLDPDNSCWSQPWESGHRCYRTENPAWDPYRSDCSAFVSWAWGLPPPGRVTQEFAPFVNDITHAIDAAQLAPGDAVNNSDHVMLFTGWVIAGQRATFVEEPGCSTVIKHAHEFTSDVSISGTSIYVPYTGMSFTAIRYDGFGSGGGGGGSSGGGSGGCVVGGLYCGGDKVSGSSNTLYRCTGGSSGTVEQVCANGCSVNPGANDSCKSGGSTGSGGCVVGGLYCGGDKVSGSSNTLYRCTGGSSGTVQQVCANGCSVNAGTNDSCKSGSGATGGGNCVVGGLYCGGDKVSGNTGTLYRCTGGSSGTVVGNCSDGCEVVSGQNDECRGAGDCVVGGLYCGGDKVSGNPTTLYRCTGGNTGTVASQCANGCAVLSGQNDACR